MKKITLLLCISMVPFLLKAQDYNLGFEVWSPDLDVSTVTADPAFPGCYSWMLGNAIGTGGNLAQDSILPKWSAIPFGIIRTNDAHSGNYAAIVHMWYNGAAGLLALGSSSENLYSDIPKVHLEHRIHGISGFYKYKVDSFVTNDTYRKAAIFNIVTYKKNPVSGVLDLLSHDSLQFERSGIYREFYLPVTYADTSIVPDSVSIWFGSKGYNSGITSCMLAHFLYLDDLQFHFQPYSLSFNDPVDLKGSFRIYPNPAKGKLNLEYKHDLQIQSIQLADLPGKNVRTFGKEEKLLSVEGLASGIYFLKINAKEGSVTEKIVIE